MLKYNTALPYFPKEDIKEILKDIKYILEGNGMLSMGPKVKQFEFNLQKYFKVNQAVAINSCTAGLETILQAIGLSKSDEVIIPVQTFIATASCVLRKGGKLQFCNIDENYLMDVDELKTLINKHTKAIILVHFAGLIHPRIREIQDIAKQNKIFLI